MLVKELVARWLAQGAQAAQAAGELPELDYPPITVERTKRAQHGDFASSVALQWSRVASLPPRRIAQAIIDHLPTADFVERVELAGKGFINVFLAEAWLAQQVEPILAAGAEWGRLDLGHGQRVQVEFVSANPTGPLHVGRTWGAVLGDTLARLLEHAGYQVTREYYFNNAGRQMQLLAESVRARYLELLDRPATFPAEGYQGEYVSDIARGIHDEVGAGWAEAELPAFRERAEAWLLADIQQSLERMDVHFDVWFSEQALYASGAVERTLAALREAGYAYEAEGAIWFRATEFGADKDRVLVRSTGEPTYRLPDIAYHIDKLERGFARIIDVLGIDHKDEFPDVVNAVRALGYPADRIRPLFHQFISLVRRGEPVKMSTRRATYVTLDDLLDAVTQTHPESGVTLPGKDAVRFMLLTRGPGSPLQFDLDLVLRQSLDNPVYYVQYAHARQASLLNKAREEGWTDWSSGDASQLTQATELELIRRLLELPERIELGIEELAPHHLAMYAQDLASAFHAFYRDCPVINPEAEALTRARLKLVEAAGLGLSQTLRLMGVSAPQRM